MDTELAGRVEPRFRLPFSLFQQATLRLVSVFLISLLLFGLTTVWLYNATIDKVVRHEIDRASRFYSGRIVSLEHRWREEALRFKNGLEFSRLLEDPGSRWLKLNSYLVSQGGSDLFGFVLIADHQGKVVFRYGGHARSLPDEALRQERAGWYFHPEDRTLFRVFHFPIWLGADGSGRMSVLVPADNAMLNRNVAQDAYLDLLWQGSIVASSSLNEVKGKLTLDPGKSQVEIDGKRHIQHAVKWPGEGEAVPILVARREVGSLFSVRQFVVGVAVVLATLTLLLWLVLGIWLVRLARRMASLDEASRSFAEDCQITPEIRQRLDDSSAGREDEISAVARSLERLTHTVEERTHERDVREAQLRENEARFREIAATLGSGLLVLDRKGDLSYMNPEAERLLDWESEEILGRNVHALVHYKRPDGSAYCVDDCPIYTAFHQGEAYRGNEVFCRHDGSFMPVIVSSSPIRHDGKIEGMVLAFHDISELKQIEQALKRSEQEYRAILDNMRDTYFRASLQDGAILAMSRSCHELLGWHAEELVTSTFFGLFASEDARLELLGMLERNGGAVFDHEMALKRKDGSKIWVSANAHYFQDEQGILSGIEGTLRDITQRRRMESELIRSRDELEKRVNERTVELVKARDLAEQASMAKTEFLSRMSHELRTPLNAVLGFAQLMESDTDKPLCPEQQDGIRHILAAGWHLLDLVNEVLDLSGIDQGNLKLKLESVKLAPMVESSLAKVAAQAAQRGIAIENGLALAVTGWVLADKGRLEQVLHNLLTNAVKYNRENGRIRLSCDLLGSDWLRISVSDTGNGIPPEQIDQLFKPFSRLKVNRAMADGTGVGLALVKKLVEMMGGTVGVESAEGRGSTFWIQLRQSAGQGAGPPPGV